MAVRSDWTWGRWVVVSWIGLATEVKSNGMTALPKLVKVLGRDDVDAARAVNAWSKKPATDIRKTPP